MPLWGWQEVQDVLQDFGEMTRRCTAPAAFLFARLANFYLCSFPSPCGILGGSVAILPAVALAHLQIPPNGCLLAPDSPWRPTVLRLMSPFPCDATFFPRPSPEHTVVGLKGLVEGALRRAHGPLLPSMATSRMEPIPDVLTWHSMPGRAAASNKTPLDGV